MDLGLFKIKDGISSSSSDGMSADTENCPGATAFANLFLRAYFAFL